MAGQDDQVPWEEGPLASVHGRQVIEGVAKDGAIGVAVLFAVALHEVVRLLHTLREGSMDVEDRAPATLRVLCVVRATRQPEFPLIHSVDGNAYDGSVFVRLLAVESLLRQVGKLRVSTTVPEHNGQVASHSNTQHALPTTAGPSGYGTPCTPVNPEKNDLRLRGCCKSPALSTPFSDALGVARSVPGNTINQPHESICHAHRCHRMSSRCLNRT